jgi:hypothetical protein
MNGVSQFYLLHQLFKEHQDELTPVFLANKPPSSLVDKDDKTQILNLHEAYVNEIGTTFSAALSKDRLYKRPVGFLEEQ